VLLDGFQSAFIVYVNTHASMEFKYINLLLYGLQSVVIVRVGTLFLYIMRLTCCICMLMESECSIVLMDGMHNVFKVHVSLYSPHVITFD